MYVFHILKIAVKNCALQWGCFLTGGRWMFMGIKNP